MKRAGRKNETRAICRGHLSLADRLRIKPTFDDDRERFSFWEENIQSRLTRSSRRARNLPTESVAAAGPGPASHEGPGPVLPAATVDVREGNNDDDPLNLRGNAPRTAPPCPHCGYGGPDTWDGVSVGGWTGPARDQAIARQRACECRGFVEMEEEMRRQSEQAGRDMTSRVDRQARENEETRKQHALEREYLDERLRQDRERIDRDLHHRDQARRVAGLPPLIEYEHAPAWVTHPPLRKTPAEEQAAFDAMSEQRRLREVWHEGERVRAIAAAEDAQRRYQERREEAARNGTL